MNGFENIDVKKDLKDFISKNYLPKHRSFDFDDNTSFLGNSVLDSIGVIELTAYLQEKYDIKIKVNEIVPDNFDTLNRLDRYINRKLTEKS